MVKSVWLSQLFNIYLHKLKNINIYDFSANTEIINNADLRAELKHKGKEQLKKFSASKTFLETIGFEDTFEYEKTKLPDSRITSLKKCLIVFNVDFISSYL